MPLRSLKGFRKSIGFHLALWYSGIFILSSLLLFTFAFFHLSSSLKEQDKGAIQLKLKELSSLFQEGGMKSLEREVSVEKKFEKECPFFIRLADDKKKTLFLIFPYQWADFDIKQLEKSDFKTASEWIHLPAKYSEHILEIASVKLANGYLLQTGMSTERREMILMHFREIFVAIIIPLILVGVVGGTFLGFRALKPIRDLIDTIRSVSTGKMEARVPSSHTGDELDVLIGFFNGMLEKIETLILAMKGSLDNIAHDLRTPITRLRGMAERALQAGQNSGEYEEALAGCIEESEQIQTILKTLMDISEAETGAMKLYLEEVSFSVIAARVLDMYGFVAEEKAIQIHISIPGEFRVNADPSRLGQVLANLLDNSIKYTQKKGHIYLEARQTSSENIITIRDTGVGIHQQELPKIWDRLYRGDQSRPKRGLGLGLSLVKAVVNAHKGRIDVVSEPGKGSTFNIYLPVNNSPLH